MRALTVKQPWAWAIAWGGKDIENRSRPTSYRGPLAIHAGATWDPLWDQVTTNNPQMLRPACDTPGEDAYPRGAIIAVAELSDVCSAATGRTPRPCQCGRWAQRGQCHWHLTNVRALRQPVPCRGALGLWTPPDDVLTVVTTQLQEGTRP
jgi:ASCH domain